MDEETKKKYIKAGKIAREALEYGKTLIKKGNKLVDALDKIEEKILSLGGGIAFPSQISMDNIAAHYCPEAFDETVFDSQLCCLDVGVHVDGFIGDNALTVDLSGKYSELVKASRDALNNVVKIIKSGVTLSEIGKTVYDTISGYGFSPVRNLSGHGLSQYNIHTKPSIPNFDTGDNTTINQGRAFAIEPFASTGAGIVQDSGSEGVYSFIVKKPVRSQITREILSEIETYKGLPFAKRWLTRKFGAKANLGLRELLMKGIIKGYAPLSDMGKGLVSQAEHTFIIDSDGNVVVTTLG